MFGNVGSFGANSLKQRKHYIETQMLIDLDAKKDRRNIFGEGRHFFKYTIILSILFAKVSIITYHHLFHSANKMSCLNIMIHMRKVLKCTASTSVKVNSQTPNRSFPYMTHKTRNLLTTLIMEQLGLKGPPQHREDQIQKSHQYTKDENVSRSSSRTNIK